MTDSIVPPTPKATALPPVAPWFPPRGWLGFFMGLIGMVLLEIAGVSVFVSGFSLLMAVIDVFRFPVDQSSISGLMNIVMWLFLPVLALGLAWFGRHSRTFIVGVVAGGFFPFACVAMIGIYILLSGGIRVY